MKILPYPRNTNCRYCHWNISDELFFAVNIKNAILLSLIPCSILTTLQILSYRAIKKSSQQFPLEIHRMRTVRQVRKTFFVVVTVFLFLTVPTVIHFTTISFIQLFYPKLFRFAKDLTLLYQLARFFNLLLACNSCVNPLIYAKIQKKLTRSTQKIHRRITQWLQTPLTLQKHRMSIDSLKQPYLIQMRNILT